MSGSNEADSFQYNGFGVAQIKYIKKKSAAASPPEEAPPKRKATRPKANTKAKIVQYDPKKAESKAAARKARAATSTTDMNGVTKPVTKGRGRPKKEEAVETKTKAVASKSRAPTRRAAATKGTSTKVEREKTASIEDDDSEVPVKVSRKRKAENDAPAVSAKKLKALTKGPVLREPPTQRLHVYVFGEGTAGELGLGTAKNAIDVKRPRLNPNLKAETVGVVQVAAGGMHCVALTHDNKVLTWGVNDQGTLGRDTEWTGGLRDVDASDDSDDEDEDNGLNPKESIPGEVDWSAVELKDGTRFVQVAAGDSTSFALTDDGLVYGWGTFRGNDGIFGFTPDVKVATRPVLVPGLKKVVDIKAGANHALAMDSAGAVFAWGSGQQNQLGRRVVERTKAEGLKPREFGLPKGPKKGIVSIETGGYHNFAIAKTGDVYSWGLNNFGETGIMDNAGQDDAVIVKPQVVKALRGKKIVSIKGGGHHSLAATEEGECLIWGRIDGHQIGISDGDIAKLPEDAIIKDEHDRPRILAEPQRVSAIKGAATVVATSSDHNLVITKEGKAWSWGFSANYQTGQGTTDDIIVATVIDNTATREKKLNFATTGGQFSVLTAPADDGPKTNGA